MIESQERTITELLKAVREQHDQLDHQKSKIKNLEDKVGDMFFFLLLPSNASSRGCGIVQENVCTASIC